MAGAGTAAFGAGGASGRGAWWSSGPAAAGGAAAGELEVAGLRLRPDRLSRSACSRSLRSVRHSLRRTGKGLRSRSGRRSRRGGLRRSRLRRRLSSRLRCGHRAVDGGWSGPVISRSRCWNRAVRRCRPGRGSRIRVLLSVRSWLRRRRLLIPCNQSIEACLLKMQVTQSHCQRQRNDDQNQLAPASLWFLLIVEKIVNVGRRPQSIGVRVMIDGRSRSAQAKKRMPGDHWSGAGSTVGRPNLAGSNLAGSNLVRPNLGAKRRRTRLYVCSAESRWLRDGRFLALTGSGMGGDRRRRNRGLPLVLQAFRWRRSGLRSPGRRSCCHQRSPAHSAKAVGLVIFVAASSAAHTPSYTVLSFRLTLLPLFSRVGC